MDVKVLATALPLTVAECEHGRRIGCNLSAGIALHLGDSSRCRRTGLGPHVDAELVDRDEFGSAMRGVLDQAMTRLEGTLLQMASTGEEDRAPGLQ